MCVALVADSEESGGGGPARRQREDAGPADAALPNPRKPAAGHGLVQRRTTVARHQARPHQEQTVTAATAILVCLVFP